MAISAGDVRRIAALARLHVDDTTAATLAVELEGIARHMQVLASVDTKGVEEAIGVGARGLPVRDDTGPPIPLAVALEALAPHMQDGFLLVPRLASHADPRGA